MEFEICQAKFMVFAIENDPLKVDFFQELKIIRRYLKDFELSPFNKIYLESAILNFRTLVVIHINNLSATLNDMTSLVYKR